MCSLQLHMKKNRIQQLDYLKGVFIILMVTFHLSLVENTYPQLRSVVYMFHMPAFLIITGYLSRVGERNTAQFTKKLVTTTLLPYLLFESLYLLMQVLLGNIFQAHNALANLSCQDYIRYIVLQPLGTYWYLHTMFIGLAVCHIIYRVLRLQGLSALILSGTVLYGLSYCIEGLDWGNMIYLLMGIVVCSSRKPLLQVITPSFFAALPILLICLLTDDYDKCTIQGMAMTVCVISLLLSLYPYLGTIQNMLTWLGRNSLSIVVFSPIFTVASKTWSDSFSFDPSAVSFLTITLVFVLSGCLCCAWLSDQLHLSHYLFGKKSIYSPLKMNTSSHQNESEA